MYRCTSVVADANTRHEKKLLCVEFGFFDLREPVLTSSVHVSRLPFCSRHQLDINCSQAHSITTTVHDARKQSKGLSRRRVQDQIPSNLFIHI